MKKSVLVMLVILCNLCFISCESDDDDELFGVENPIEIGGDDDTGEVLPPRKRKIKDNE